MNNVNKHWRFPFIGALMTVLPLLILVQIFRIQIDPERMDRLMSQSQDWSWERKLIEPARGQIYDVYGVLLAGNKTVYEVGVELQFVRNPQTIAEVLNDVLELDYGQVLGAASIPFVEGESVYRVVVDNVSQEQIEKLEREIQRIRLIAPQSREEKPPSLSGLVYKPHLARTYPENSTASNMLGFVGGDNIGYFGVEAYFDKMLAGETKMVSVPLDPIAVGETPNVPDGSSLVLTFDITVQRAMEALIDDAVDRNDATSGTLVVINPKNRRDYGAGDDISLEFK